MKSIIQYKNKLKNQLDSLNELLAVSPPPKKLGNDVNVWFHYYTEMLLSKTYTESNIDDLLWFYSNGLASCKRIADIGTGGGYISHLLSYFIKDVTAYEYIGNWTDQKHNSKDYTKAFMYSQSLVKIINKNISFKFYKNFPLSEKTESFDGIILYAVLEHIEPNLHDSFLEEMYRILKPSGQLYIAKLPRTLSYQEFISRKLKIGGHSHLYSKNTIDGLLRKHRFQIKKIDQTGLFFNQPNSIMNLLFPILGRLDSILSRSFLSVVSHDFRIIARKI